MADYQEYNYFHPQHRASRDGAFARSDGICQFCGQREAREAHHWRMGYMSETETTADELTALCGICHRMATTIRRFKGDIFTLMAIFEKDVGKCYTGRPLQASDLSSCTLAKASTPESLPTKKRRKSPKNGEQPD